MRSQHFRRTIRLGTSLFAVVVLVLLLMVQSSVAQTSGKSFKIGVLAPKTGFGASWFAAGSLDLKLLKRKLSL